MNYRNKFRPPVILQPSFLPPQPQRQLRIGISQWGSMEPDCLLTPSNIHCDPGFELEIIHTLMAALNVTVEIKYSPTLGCGYVDDNGTFGGLLGMLQRNEVDFIGNLCTVDEYRSNISWLINSWPVLLQKQAFLIKAPILGASFQLFAPFTIPVWLLFSLATVVFLILFTIFFKIFEKQRMVWSFLNALDNVCNISVGLECVLKQPVWFYYICFVGYVQLLYSTFVTIVVLRPSDVEIPFGNQIELADALYRGDFRILDYKTTPFVRCYDEWVCNKLNAAYALHKHYFFNSTNTNAMLQILLEQPNLVLVKSRHTLRTYLDAFPGRAKLWLIDDEISGVEWFSFFFRRDFELAHLFNKVLMLMGDSKDNINHWYNYLSYQSIQTKKIVGKVSEHTRFSIEMLHGHFYVFTVTVIISFTGLFLEFVFYKFQRQLKRSVQCLKKEKIVISLFELEPEYSQK